MDCFRTYMLNVFLFSLIFFLAIVFIEDKFISNTLCILSGLLLGVSSFKYWILENLYRCIEDKDEYYIMSVKAYSSMKALLDKLSF